MAIRRALHAVHTLKSFPVKPEQYLQGLNHMMHQARLNTEAVRAMQSLCAVLVCQQAALSEPHQGYAWLPAADMAFTVAPTSLLRATTCRLICGPLCMPTKLPQSGDSAPVDMNSCLHDRLHASNNSVIVCHMVAITHLGQLSCCVLSIR